MTQPRLIRKAAEWVAHLCDPRGRCDRKGLALVALVLLPAQVVFGIAIVAAGLSWHHPAVVAGKLVFLWIAIVAGVKRLHDLGLRGWWMLVGFVGYLVWSVVVGIAAIALFGPGAVVPGSFALSLVVALNALAMLGALLYLHFAKGQSGPNRYGPPPGPLGFAGALPSQDIQSQGPVSAQASGERAQTA